MSTNDRLGDGRWRVRLEGFPDVTTDDLTLDDIEIAEKVSGVPWILINPLASAKEAKAMLTLLLIRADIPENEALKAAGKTPLTKMVQAFSYELADRQPATASSGSSTGEAVPPHPAPTSVAG